MDFITNIAIENLRSYKDKFLTDYFIMELSKLSLKKLRYKAVASSIFKFEEDLNEEN